MSATKRQSSPRSESRHLRSPSNLFSTPSHRQAKQPFSNTHISSAFPGFWQTHTAAVSKWKALHHLAITTQRQPRAGKLGNDNALAWHANAADACEKSACMRRGRLRASSVQLRARLSHLNVYFPGVENPISIEGFAGTDQGCRKLL